MTFTIPRDQLAQAFPGNPRLQRAFEDQSRVVNETADVAQQGIAATGALREAAFVTLSENTELPNERVLRNGDGIRFALTADSITIHADGLVKAAGVGTITLIAEADTVLNVPQTGTLIAYEDFPGPFADDTAAAGGGVAVGQVYRGTTGLRARLA